MGQEDTLRDLLPLDSQILLSLRTDYEVFYLSPLLSRYILCEFDCKFLYD